MMTNPAMSIAVLISAANGIVTPHMVSAPGPVAGSEPATIVSRFEYSCPNQLARGRRPGRSTALSAFQVEVKPLFVGGLRQVSRDRPFVLRPRLCRPHHDPRPLHGDHFDRHVGVE